MCAKSQLSYGELRQLNHLSGRSIPLLPERWDLTIGPLIRALDGATERLRIEGILIVSVRFRIDKLLSVCDGLASKGATASAVLDRHDTPPGTSMRIQSSAPARSIRAGQVRTRGIHR